MESEELELDAQSRDEVAQIQEELADFNQQLACKEQRLQMIRDRWDVQKARVAEQAAVHRAEIDKREERLKELIDAVVAASRAPVFVPPGPPQLRFVEAHAFHLGATAVIVANMITMFLELMDKSYSHKLFWLDQFFMVFYVVEISLKAALLRKHLLFGVFSQVCWNWLDLVIVVSGLIDMYLKPLLVLVGAFPENSVKGPSVLSFLRFLRLARLARILKIVKEFLKADMSWAEGDAFQTFIMGVIGINSLIMGFEADMPDFFGWFYVEQLLLLIFSFELLVRLKFQGCRFFLNPATLFWNWLDFTIVTGGIVDQWMMPAISFIKTLMGQPPADAGGVGQIMMLLRMARLLRILRLVRLVKNIPPLYTLVLGIIEAMQGMTWVLLLTVVVLYTFALLAVRLVGHGLVFGGEAPTEAGVFPTVLETMFVLFKIMNADLGPMTGLFDVMPVMKLITVTFMIISTWSILSILTAVVSENMLSVSENTKEDDTTELDELAEERSRVKLTEIFEAETSGEHTRISASEFRAMLADEDKMFELCDAADMPEASLRSVFETMACEVEDGEAYVKFEDFLDGLVQDAGSVSERSMMRLEKRLASLEHILWTVYQADVETKAVSFTGSRKKTGSDAKGSNSKPGSPEHRAAAADGATFAMDSAQELDGNVAHEGSLESGSSYTDDGHQMTKPGRHKLWRPLHKASCALLDEEYGLESTP